MGPEMFCSEINDIIMNKVIITEAEIKYKNESEHGMLSMQPVKNKSKKNKEKERSKKWDKDK
jgi:hypothetical protein